MIRKNSIIITIIFVTILILTFLLNIFTEDNTISESERRKLAQLPEISFEGLINGKTIKEFEDYTVDQFIFREFFRNAKSFWSRNIFMQKDDNKFFVKDNGLYKMEYPLKENNVQNTAKKIKRVYDKYLQGQNVYYAIIPDKNYYLENDSHLKINYLKLKNIMQENLNDLTYIDIWDKLEIGDYYRTDLHWKQENLVKIVNEFEKEMDLDITLNSYYEKENIGEYYGTYYSQVSNNVGPDEMHILTNEIIENCTTYNYEKKETNKVYNLKKKIDKYDTYLSGATAIIEINNSYRKDDKELIIFRDSFGSSIAPLFIENYKKITLIDLRYVSADVLEQYVKFDKQDVIFLYSTVILNQNILK